MAGELVAVTGAAGFIGAHLSERLAREGYRVRALDARPAPLRLSVPGIEYQQVDIRDHEQTASSLTGVETVYHLAAAHLEVHAPESTYRAVNVAATEQLVWSCAAAGVRRLVHTSSVGVYGHVPQPPAVEDSPKFPSTVYERTKLAGEQAALRAAGALDVSAIVLRPAWVYGPGCPRTAKLFRALSRGRFVYVGAGTNLRHPIYIADMVRAYLLAGTAPGSLSGRIFVIAGPRAVTVREFVEACALALGVRRPRLVIPRLLARGLGLAAEVAYRLARREPPVSRRSLAFFEHDSAFDTTAAARDLSFRAAVELEEGLNRTVAAWRGEPPAMATGHPASPGGSRWVERSRAAARERGAGPR